MKSRTTQFLVGIFISAVFLYLAFRNVDFPSLWRAIGSVNLLWCLATMVLIMVNMYLRALRWEYFIRPDYRIPVGRLFPPVMIGFAFNNVFPARAGEFARAYVLSTKEKIGFPFTLATLVVERFFDAVILLLSFAVALIILPEFDPSLSITYSNQKALTGQELNFLLLAGLFFLLLILTFVYFLTRGCIFACPADKPTPPRSGLLWKVAYRLQRTERNPRLVKILLLLILVVVLLIIGVYVFPLWGPGTIYQFGRDYVINAQFMESVSQKLFFFVVVIMVIFILLMIGYTRRLLERIITRMPLLPLKVKETLIHILHSFSQGLNCLQRVNLIALIIFYSLLVWISIALGILTAGYAFPQLHITVAESLLIMVIIAIAVSIPSAPGYWGLFEFGGLFALKVLGITQEDSLALGYSLVLHSLQMFPIVVIGLYYAWRERVHIRPLSDSQSTQ